MRENVRISVSQTVSLVLDATTANAAIFAITAHADDREAHVREVEQFGQSLPEGSYGRRNRQAIAARETRVVGLLRAVEHAPLCPPRPAGRSTTASVRLPPAQSPHLEQKVPGYPPGQQGSTHQPAPHRQAPHERWEIRCTRYRY